MNADGTGRDDTGTQQQHQIDGDDDIGTGRTFGQTDKQTGGQAGGQSVRQAGVQTDGQTDR